MKVDVEPKKKNKEYWLKEKRRGYVVSVVEYLSFVPSSSLNTSFQVAYNNRSNNASVWPGIACIGLFHTKQKNA